MGNPFGMIMPGRKYTSSEKYRYGFQGQEQDDAVKGDGNSINYKYRMHDPRLGRFFSVDPLAATYPYRSPYVFSGNQVVHTIELEGLEPLDELGMGDQKGYIRSSTKEEFEANPGLQGVRDALFVILTPVNFIDNVVANYSDEVSRKSWSKSCTGTTRKSKVPSRSAPA